MALPYRDEAVVLVERQPAQDHGVHHREDRRAGADAERQHEERDRRERLGRLERTEGGFQIVAHDDVQDAVERVFPLVEPNRGYLPTRAAVIASPSSRRSTTSIPRITRPSAVKSPSLCGCGVMPSV